MVPSTAIPCISKLFILGSSEQPTHHDNSKQIRMDQDQAGQKGSWSLVCEERETLPSTNLSCITKSHESGELMHAKYYR